MNSRLRKTVYFDLETKELKKYYPSPSWRSAYSDINRFLADRGIAHEQGSGYISTGAMSEAAVLIILHAMIVEYPWLNKCVSVFTVNDAPITPSHNVTFMFDKHAPIPERKKG